MQSLNEEMDKVKISINNVDSSLKQSEELKANISNNGINTAIEPTAKIIFNNAENGQSTDQDNATTAMIVEEVHTDNNGHPNESSPNYKIDVSSEAINMDSKNACSSTAEVRSLLSVALANSVKNEPSIDQSNIKKSLTADQIQLANVMNVDDDFKESNCDDSNACKDTTATFNNNNRNVTSASSSPLSTYNANLRSYGQAALASLSNVTSYGLNSLQNNNSSPPPHSYRHTRAYRHFKNPPQPHMCIHTTLQSGEELFINVLSWTRIVIPQEPLDPIPLYGGMRVPPGSPRNSSIVFAVMANPEVLKDSGRHSKDPEERRAIVELMCDFVEAMNPGIKLVRNAEILKDRDIYGELKDVWNAVQAQRDREREEQLLQQRHQQYHYHNVTTSLSSFNGGISIGIGGNFGTQQLFSRSALLNDGSGDNGTSIRSRKLFEELMPNPIRETERADPTISLLAEKLEDSVKLSSKTEEGSPSPSCSGVTNSNGVFSLENKLSQVSTFSTMKRGSFLDQHVHKNGGLQSNGRSKLFHNCDVKNFPVGLSANLKDKNNCTINSKNVSDKNTTENGKLVKNVEKELSMVTDIATTSTAITTALNAVTTMCNGNNSKANTGGEQNRDNSMNASGGASISAAGGNIATATSTTPTTTPPVTKREKLSGFLTNGCMFPRFKHNKNKEKDKDKEKDKEKEKEKETKPKDREKYLLLNALMPKSKEKKTNANQVVEKTQKQQGDHSIFGKKGVNSSADNGIQKKSMDNQMNSATATTTNNANSSVNTTNNSANSSTSNTCGNANKTANATSVIKS